MPRAVPSTSNVKAFLSYNSKDANLARRLALDLESAHISVWLDQWQLKVGEAFEQEIVRGIENAEFVIVLLTRASVTSDWVNREWRHKILGEAQFKRIGVIPVRGERCIIPDLLAQRSHADISGGSYPFGLRRLLEMLRHYTRDDKIAIPKSPPLEVSEFSNMLPIVVPIGIEVSADLIPLFETSADGSNRMLDQLLPQMREALANEFGFSFPGVSCRGNETDLPAQTALIMIEEIQESSVQVGMNDVVVAANADKLAAIGVHGEVREQAIGNDSVTRIAQQDRALVSSQGMRSWDAGEFLVAALHSVVRKHASLFLDIDVTRNLALATDPAAAERLIPSIMTWPQLTNILKSLVEEGFNISALSTIMAALATNEAQEADVNIRSELARQALRTQITERFVDERGVLSVLRLSVDIEQRLEQSILQTSSGPYLKADPMLLQGILASVRSVMGSREHAVFSPPILTTIKLRRYMRKLVELEFPSLQVLSFGDLLSDLHVQVVHEFSVPT
jgi:type III secretory pathway component EscV